MASGGSLEATFKKFATKTNGEEATTKDITRWFLDAACFGKACSSNSVDIAFSAVKSIGKPNLLKGQMKDLIKKLAPDYRKDHNLDDDAAGEAALTAKLAAAEPKHHGITKTSKTGLVDKMTDTTKYTGTHKERFDESGKGKGVAGRREEINTSGYVGGYRGEGTYDCKAKKKPDGLA